MGYGTPEIQQKTNNEIVLNKPILSSKARKNGKTAAITWLLLAELNKQLPIAIEPLSLEVDDGGLGNG